MAFSWQVSAIAAAIFFVVGCSGYNEDPCQSNGGNCQHDSNACSGSYESGKCPTQGSRIRCCMPAYYNEDPCNSNGGSCQPDTLACSGGSYVSGQCPTQAGNIRCCKPSYYNEDPCLSNGGNCQEDTLSCIDGSYVSSQCPTQGASIRCCMPTSFYNEDPCLSNEGNCQEETLPCNDGSYVSNQCPTQGASIRCCLPTSTPSGPLTCSGIGGNCQNAATCNGISVSRLCPGSSTNRCCVNPPGTDLIDQHLNRREGGLYLIGYIPTAGSGVTIATGVDLGQQSNSGLQTLGVSASIRNKLSPYLGLKTRNQVHNAGLNENNLKLTLNEGLDLDHAFKADLLRRIARYDSNLTIRGRAVLASLTHWCYAAVRTNTDQKCYISGCPNYLRNAMGAGSGSDADLKAALVSLKACAISKGRPSWVSNRHQAEINFLP